MRVDIPDLVRAFQSNGEAFEDFVHDLVRTVARSCGIDPVNVHWDFRSLEEWLAELSPRELTTRVRDLTGQEFWAGAVGRERGREERTARYDSVAAELIESPLTLHELAQWLAAPEARSAGFLAARMGLADVRGHLTAIVRDWLRHDQCRVTAVSYLGGMAEREGQLPAEWASFLDDMAADRPELVAVATTHADVGRRGFERLLRLVDRLPTPVSQFLRPLGFGSWLRVPSSEDRTRIAELLVQLLKNGDIEAASVGVDLVRMWVHVDSNAMNQALASATLALASQARLGARGHDLYTWHEVLRLLSPFHPREVAELIVGRMTDTSSRAGWSGEENVEVLTCAAAIDPSAVMEVIGRALLDKQRRPFFGILVYQGLFEAIGLQHIDAWLQRHGYEHLRWLARHFPSPYLDKSGAPFVHPLTDWLFREHENDDQAFQSFLMGRSSGKVWTQADIDPARKRREMQPFLQHELRRVREWAEYEIQEHEQEAAFFREMDEEDGRR